MVAIGNEVDFYDDNLLDYINEYNPILMFEIHDRWFNEKEYFNQLYSSYPLVSCFQTRAYGKLGIITRLIILALYFKAKEIYFVGCDGCPGLSIKTKEN